MNQGIFEGQNVIGIRPGMGWSDVDPGCPPGTTWVECGPSSPTKEKCQEQGVWHNCNWIPIPAGLLTATFTPDSARSGSGQQGGGSTSSGPPTCPSGQKLEGGKCVPVAAIPKNTWIAGVPNSALIVGGVLLLANCIYLIVSGPKRKG